MRIRAVLKSLLFAYALTGVLLLLLAFALFSFDLGETVVDVGITAVYGRIYGRQDSAQR